MATLDADDLTRLVFIENGDNQELTAFLRKMYAQINPPDPGQPDPGTGVSSPRWVMPEDFSGIGDGVAADDAALLAAKLALVTAGGGVLALTGTYRVAGAGNGIDLDMSNVAIIGFGRGTILMDNLDGDGEGTGHGVVVRTNRENVAIVDVNVEWKVEPSARSKGDAFRFEGYPSDTVVPLGGVSFRTTRNILFTGCTAKKAPQCGAIFMGCSDIRWDNFRAEDCLADQLHFNACKNVIGGDLISVNCGDDGLAIVTYAIDPTELALDPTKIFNYPASYLADRGPFRQPALGEWSNFNFSAGKVVVRQKRANGNGCRISGSLDVSVESIRAEQKTGGSLISALIVDSAIIGTGNGTAAWTYHASRGVRVGSVRARRAQKSVICETYGLASTGSDDYRLFDVEIGSINGKSQTQDVFFAAFVKGISVGKIKGETAGFDQGVRLTSCYDMAIGEIDVTGASVFVNRATGLTEAQWAGDLDPQDIRLGKVRIKTGRFSSSSTIKLSIDKLTVDGASGTAGLFAIVSDLEIGQYRVKNANRSLSTGTNRHGLNLSRVRRATIDQYICDHDDASFVFLEVGGGSGPLISQRSHDIDIKRMVYRNTKNQTGDDIILQGGANGPFNLNWKGKHFNGGEGAPAWRYLYRNQSEEDNSTSGASASDLLTFDTRAQAVGVNVGTAKLVRIKRQIANGPLAMTVYEVLPGATGNATDALDLAAGKIAFASNLYGQIVAEDAVYRPESFGAPRNGTDDDKVAINDTRAFAMVQGGGIVACGPHAYVIDATTGGPLDMDTAAGFGGVQIRGTGIDETRFRCKVTGLDDPVVRARGGSGNNTPKGIAKLTIEPFDSGSVAKGVGLQVLDHCFFSADEVKIGATAGGFAVGVEQANTTAAGRYSEFCSFNRIRCLENTRGYQAHRRGGDNSFHGNRFHDFQINIPSGGTGVSINETTLGGVASTGQIYLYNCQFHFNLFGGDTGTRHAIKYANINCEGNVGHLQLEKALVFSGSSGPFVMRGPVTSISAVTFSEDNAFRFSEVRAQKRSVSTWAAFSDTRMSGITPHPMHSLDIMERVNSLAAGLIAVRGTNIEGVGIITYPGGDARGGLSFWTSPFGNTSPSGMSYAGHISYNLGEIRSTSGTMDIGQAPVLKTSTTTIGSPVVTGMTAADTTLAPGWAVSGSGIPGGTTIKKVDSGSQITLSANATTAETRLLTCTPPAGQLLLKNGRVGGRFGRIPAVREVPISASLQSLALFSNNVRGSASRFSLRIYDPADTTAFDLAIVGFYVASLQTGQSGIVETAIIEQFADSTNGAVEIGEPSVNSSGQLILPVNKTDRILAIEGADESWVNMIS